VYASISCDKLLRMLQTHLFSHLVRTYRAKRSRRSTSKPKSRSRSRDPLAGHLGQQPAVIIGGASPARQQRGAASAVSRELEDYAYLTQVRGIPQGSVLSPILCNLYYGHAERVEFLSDPREVRRATILCGCV
jgi:hypothetical protein